MVFAPRYTITDAIAAALTRIERARGFLEAATLSEEWIRAMQHRALVLEAHHTTHIEGTRLTLEQSERLLEGKRVRDADPEDARELLNYREAFDLVGSFLGSGGPITEGLIREIHRRLVRGVRGDSAAPGEYRKVQNYVVEGGTGRVVYTPPPPQDVPPLMAELVAWLQAETSVNPVLVAGTAQFRLVDIHPFVDGNGRTARLLSTLCLYRSGYDFKRLFSLSEFYDRDRPAYYEAIRSVRDRGLDLTGWLEYFARGLAAQMQEVQARGERAIRRDVALARARGAGLKRGPVGVLAFLHERGPSSAAACSEGLRTNRRTLQRYLKLLVKEGFAREVGRGPTDPMKRYEPVS